MIPKEFTPKARAIIAERSGGMCEGCNLMRAAQVHHRKYKSRLGRGNVANGLHVCITCHGIAHTLTGELRGWSVRSGFDPAEQPVMHARLGPVLLDDLGGFVSVTGEGFAY